MELPSKSSTKRARAAPNLVTQVASCVVDGCNSDLTNCRDYHRRHRVCELHSKTPTVTILGQERRFCQQCSKFHSLSEFDDGKRSCRTRLDGHNRRRRKPRQPDTLSLTTGGHFISCLQGSKFAPSSIISSSSLGYCSWPENVKVENDSMHYEGPHHQILKFVDQDGTTYPGSVFHDLRMQPHYLPACGVTSVEFMSSNSSSEYDRQSPSTGINRAIASGRAFSLLSPSSVETTTVNCWTHPTQPEQSTTMQPWIEPESQNHRNATLETTDDAVFHHQGLYRQPNVNGVCSSSHNTTLSFSWE